MRHFSRQQSCKKVSQTSRDKIKKVAFIHFLLFLAHRYSSIRENTIFQTSYLNINSIAKRKKEKQKKKIAHDYPNYNFPLKALSNAECYQILSRGSRSNTSSSPCLPYHRTIKSVHKAWRAYLLELIAPSAFY